MCLKNGYILMGVWAGLAVCGWSVPVWASSSESAWIGADDREGLTLSWTDSTKLTVAFPMTVGDVAVGSDDRLFVMPVLRGESGQSLELPLVEFAGRRNRKYFDRQAVLDRRDRQTVYGVADTVRYRQTVEVEPWMRSACLFLDLKREFENCCCVTGLEPLRLGGTRYVLPLLPAVASRSSVAEHLASDNPILKPIDELMPYNPDVPLRRMSHALYVHFPVNKSVLLEDYRDNRQTLERIIDLVSQIEADSVSSIAKIRIVGLSSPEGPVDFNTRLSHERALEFKEYLVSKGISLPDSLYEIVAGGEAWADLKDVVGESDLEGKMELIAIIDDIDDLNRREQLVRKHNGGKSYRYLCQSVFADQRNAGYIQVYYHVVSDQAAQTINEASDLLRRGDAATAIRMLEGLDDDRKWNALGVAYYYADRLEEALDAYRKAAGLGDKSAAENMRILQEFMDLKK